MPTPDEVIDKKQDEETQGEELFAGAWDEAVAKDNLGIKPPVNTDTEVKEVTDTKEVKEEKVDEKPPVATQATPSGSGDELKPPSSPTKEVLPPEPPPDYKQQYLTLQGILKHEKDEWAKKEAELAKTVEELKKNILPPKAEDNEPSEFDKMLDSLNLTDDQKAAMAEYEKEWDIVTKMEGIKRKKELGELEVKLLKRLKSLESQLSTQVSEKVKPIESFVEDTKKSKEVEAVTVHFQTISENHADYETYVTNGQLKQWIETKPKYLQRGLMDVYNSGTADEIVTMLDDFKTDNNIPIVRSNQQTQPSDSPSNVVQLSKAKQEKMKALTPPVTKKAAVNPNKAPADDFEGAFAEAIHKAENKN